MKASTLIQKLQVIMADEGDDDHSDGSMFIRIMGDDENE